MALAVLQENQLLKLSHLLLALALKMGWLGMPVSLCGFPLGRVLIMDSQFSEPLQEVEVQALQQDPGELSATKTFTITC